VYVVRWLAAFLFTQVVECPIYASALCDRPARGPRGWALGPRLAAAFGASAFTHPVVWFVIPWLWSSLDRVGGYWAMVVVAELFAWSAEGLYFRALSLPRPWAWSLVANAASFGLGLLSRSLFGWP
jgi:hypothetical protein